MYTCTTTRVSSYHNSHTFCYFCRWNGTLFCCDGLVFLSFVASFSLAVFYKAFVFNQSVSNWNTDAVTIMEESKCTLSINICGHVVYFLKTTTRDSSDHNSHVLLFCCLLFFLKRYLFVVCHPLLQCFNSHLRSIRTCPNGIRVR